MCIDYFVGLDVHHRTSTLCILTRDGREVETLTVRGGWDGIFPRLRELQARSPSATRPASAMYLQAFGLYRRLVLSAPCV